jgi:hypothetical protein
MVDRTDIDALLIGALYGELTPADEARLTAHLESHPADRSALADLTRTRAAVRDSRLFAVQLEPPPSVSAMLVREAARRAPRVEREDGWFQRFVRAFSAHPAMAAAAMLVLVVGVAGTLYLRNGDPYAGPQAAQEVATERMKADNAPPAAAPVAAPAPAEVAAAAPPPAAATPTADPAAAATGRSAGSGYAVDLAEKQQLARDEGAAPKAELRKDVGFAAPKKPVAAGKKGGIELRSPEPAPKDLEEAKADGVVRAQRGNGAAGGAASPKPQPSAAASDDRAADADFAKLKLDAPAKAAPPPPPAAPAVQAPAPETASRSADKNAELQLEKQRAQIIALVAADKCRDAAALAMSIYDRAPDYYASSIETDRNIKPCLAYVAAERRRVDQLRAAKRANAVDATEAPANRK